jgi:hypothetical protein
VLFTENGIDEVEVAKFSWPLGQLHSINYALPVAIGVVGGPETLMRVRIGGSEGCGAEVKVYTRDSLHAK